METGAIISRGDHAMRKTAVVLLTFATLLALTNPAQAADPIRVMILMGRAAGRPTTGATSLRSSRKSWKRLASFRWMWLPRLLLTATSPVFIPISRRIWAIVLNYDGPDWPADLKASFENYVKNGGGVVCGPRGRQRISPVAGL